MQILLQIFILFSLPLIGGMIALKLKAKSTPNLKDFMAFSGSFLISISFLKLLPEVYENIGNKVGAFILIGFFMQIVLEFFTNGIEHGHVHSLKNSKRLPAALLISLAFHAIFESLPLYGMFASGKNNLGLVLGIGLHELPAALALGLVFKGLKLKNNTIIIALIFYSLLTPIGYMLGYFLNDSLSGEWNYYILAMVIGAFLHISTTILFENTGNHWQINAKRMLAILTGLSIGVLSTFL